MRTMRHSAPERIVVFLPNWVGDVVMATPVLAALREHFSGAHIACIGRGAAGQLIAGSPWYDEFIPDAPSRAPRVRNFFRTVREVRRRRFDLAVLLPNSFRVALLARLGSAGRIVGYVRDGRGWLLSDGPTPERDENGRFRPVPTIDYYIGLARHLGVPVPSRRMALGVVEADRAEADRLLDRPGAAAGGPLVMLNPGASFGPSKMWAPERFGAVADELVGRCGARVIINAAPNAAERRTAALVAGAMQNKALLNLAELDNTLGLLKALLCRCDLLITNDTGPRHIAAAFGVGVVTLFGSTDPVWAQIDYDRERIIRVQLPCSPCQQKVCPQPAGPLYHRCMEDISPEMVLLAAGELLDLSPREAREESA